MTNLEKFKQFFDSMNIKYSINYTYYDDLIELTIDKNHIYQSCSNTVKVMFTNDGKFVSFQGWGE